QRQAATSSFKVNRSPAHMEPPGLMRAYIWLPLLRRDLNPTVRHSFRLFSRARRSGIVLKFPETHAWGQFLLFAHLDDQSVTPAGFVSGQSQPSTGLRRCLKVKPNPPGRALPEDLPKGSYPDPQVRSHEPEQTAKTSDDDIPEKKSELGS